ncbi:MAG: YkgJ family cysteine cluster protein [Planctomycetes bacterium]|nr:YkgJ family cysteine cluster protein [Planctomycetota bacterium]
MSGKRLTLARGIRFRCRQCGDCCRSFPVTLSPSEAERYEARDWSALGILGPVVRWRREGGANVPRLARKRDGSCRFLAEDGLCEVHRNFGEAEKPLACRLYPYVFSAGEAQTVASGHFSCSSVAAGDGVPLTSQRKQLHVFEQERSAQGVILPLAERLEFTTNLSYTPVEVGSVLDLVAKELEDSSRAFPERILAVAKFLSLVGESRFPSLVAKSAPKALKGFADGVHEKVGRGILVAPTATPLPQRLLFRSLIAFAARRDPASLHDAGFVVRGMRRLGNLIAGITFFAGTGRVQPIGSPRAVAVGDVRRRAPIADPAAPIADGALTRYFLAQITGRFLYRSTFSLSGVLPALGLLIRQYPLILLMARAACLAREGTELSREDYAAALRTADWTFGRLPLDRGIRGAVFRSALSDVEAGLAFVPWCAGEVAEQPKLESKASAS